jgi:transposase
MSRYRLVPSPAQEAVLREHCGHARYVWNLAVEQHRHWRPGRKSAPGYLEQCRQLTVARTEHPWLAAGSQMAQQQALRDFAQAMANYLGGTHDRPSWRKAGRDEGFRVVAVRPGHVRRLSRRVGEVRVPKAGWVRFRWSRAVPPEVKSYRITLAHQEHDALGQRDRRAPGRNVRQKAGLNREILRSGWGLLARRLEDKAPGRVEKIRPAFTSQRCSACGHVDAESRKNQARFVCTACGFRCNADVNAARNIAAGHAVTARGGDGVARPVNREPQLLLQSA